MVGLIQEEPNENHSRMLWHRVEFCPRH